MANSNGQGIKAVHCIHHRKPRIFFNVNVCHLGCAMSPATFQILMQNCLGEQNLTYCLIYLDNMIVFSKMEGEHVQCLHVVFNCFQEHNLKLKPIKCKFFQDEINSSGSSCLQRGGEAQQRELESCGRVHSAPNLHGNLRPFWAWLGIICAIHQGVCTYSTTLAQTSIWGRCQ